MTRMYKISEQVINSITKAMESWKVELAAGGQTCAEVKIQWGIFQRDPSLLLLVAMMPLNYILRKNIRGNRSTKSHSDFENSCPPKTDNLNNWVNVHKKTSIPEWITKGKNYPDLEGPPPKTKNYYGPITCLPMIWNILTAQIRGRNQLLAWMLHLMYMVDVNIFPRNKKELETIIQTIRIYSRDMGMELYEHVVYAQPRIGPEDRNTQTSLGFWDTNRSRIDDQTLC